MAEIIDLQVVRHEREKLIVAVAGLVSVNPHAADTEGVASFAEETRHCGVDFFYHDVLADMDHSAAIAWARTVLDPIPGWRGALFGNGEARK